MGPFDEDREVRLFVEHYDAALSLAKMGKGLECCQELEKQLAWFAPGGFEGAKALGVPWLCLLANALAHRLSAAVNVKGDCTKPVNRAMNFVRNTWGSCENDVRLAHSSWIRENYYA